MKKITLVVSTAFILLSGIRAQSRYITRTGQATIYSHTAAEDISAANNTVTGLINPSSGEIAVSVPVQGFTFEKALMQEHFNNSNFMDSKQFPKISLKGKITNAASIDFSKNGKYEVQIAGDLTIKGITKPVTERASIDINNGKITVNSKFTVKDISSYGVGKAMGKKKNNVADDIEVSYTGIYDRGEE